MAVEGWVGWHGQGKTYCAVERNLKTAIARDQVFITNAGIYGAMSLEQFRDHCDKATLSQNQTSSGRLVGFCCVRFGNWDDLMALIELVIRYRLSARILVDEGGKFLNARYWNKLDPRVQTIFQERRKVGAGVDLEFTVPSFKHVDSQLRDVTQYVHLCRRVGGSEYSHNGGSRPKLFYVKTYRPTSLSADGVGNGVKQKARAVGRKLVPFSADLAALYGTEVLDMDKPWADEVLKRPDVGPLVEPGPAVVALVQPALGRKGRR